MDQFPNRLRELRNARGYYLETVANKIGCSIAMLSDMERGNRELTYHWMKALARAYKVQVADLLNEKDNSKSLSAAQRELVDLYEAGDEQQRAQLLQMARILVGASAATKPKKAA